MFLDQSKTTLKSKENNMGKEELFTTVVLSDGRTVSIVECKGRHYFSAAIKARGDNLLMVKYIMLEIVFFDGKKIDENFLDELSVCDVISLADTIGVMLSNNFKI